MALQFVHTKANQITEHIPPSFSTGHCIKAEFSLSEQFPFAYRVSCMAVQFAVPKLTHFLQPPVTCAVRRAPRLYIQTNFLYKLLFGGRKLHFFSAGGHFKEVILLPVVQNEIWAPLRPTEKEDVRISAEAFIFPWLFIWAAPDSQEWNC